MNRTVHDQAQDTARSLMRLRTMTTGSILEATLRLYAQNARLFVATGAVILMPYIMSVVVLAAILTGSAPLIIDTIATVLVDWGLLGLDPVRVYFALVAVGLALAILIFFLVMQPIAAAALTVAVARRYVQRPATARLVYRSILPRIGPLVLTTMWAALRVIPLIMACAVLIGIPLVCYFAVAWFFIVPIMVLEERHGPASRRSRDLVSGEWWRTFEFVVVIALLFIAALAVVAVVAALVTVLPGLTDPQAQAQVFIIVAVFVVTLVLPIQAGATTLYFYGLKLRKEGVDRAAVP